MKAAKPNTIPSLAAMKNCIMRIIDLIHKMMRDPISMEDVSKFSKMNTLEDCKRYMQVMLDWYFDVIMSKGGRIAHNHIEDDMNLWIQTMFSKGNAFRSLLDGVAYSSEDRTMNPIIDMSVLFSIARSMYESLISFELLYVLPKSKDEQTIIYNLFMAHGLTERLKDLDADMKKRHPERVKQEEEAIAECMKELKDTELYKGMDRQLQNQIEYAFGKKYRYRFTDDGKMTFVEFDKAHDLLNLKEDMYHGMYSFESLQSHPSYLFLCQFRDAFKNEYRADRFMAKHATQCVLSYMSIMMVDYMKLKPEVQAMFDKLELPRRFAIGMYEDAMRAEQKYK